MLAQQVQTVIHTLFPPSCLGCNDMVTTDYGLCASCWRELPLISGPVCRSCGVPILAEDDDAAACCQDCVDQGRPWKEGRAAMKYSGLARRLVYGLKHNDRYDFAPAAARWLAQTAEPLLTADTLIAPVPLHWTRLVKRRYNQSAMLAHALGARTLRRTMLDLLIRTERTDPMEESAYEDRFKQMEGAISPNPKRLTSFTGATILLVDDVMASGATLSACAQTCYAAGAQRVDVLALARVTKDA